MLIDGDVETSWPMTLVFMLIVSSNFLVIIELTNQLLVVKLGVRVIAA